MGLSRRWFLGALAAAAVAAAAPASARMHAPYRGHRIVPATVAPPLDGLTTPSGAYSFRKLRTAYAGPAIRIRRASDNLETDINFLGFTGFTGAPWDSAAAAAHCAATTCFLSRWYDQSGNARDLVQVTTTAQPALTFGCIGGLPCFDLGTGNVVAAVATAPATGIVSMSAVARRTSGTGNCTPVRQNSGNNRILTVTGAGQWVLQAGGVAIHTVAAADGSWHAMLGIIAGAASSIVNLDGTETSNASGGTNVTAGSIGVVGIGATACQATEAIVWDNYVLSAGERAALVNNQRNFWGF